MKIPLFILGLLERFGKQHGYQIKKIIAEQISDFANIKLPTIYYHLERMETNGFVSHRVEEGEQRPDRRVYGITAMGKKHFRELLGELLDVSYKPEFDRDAIFYYLDFFTPEQVIESLYRYKKELNTALHIIAGHKKHLEAFVSREVAIKSRIIFSHHEYHYQAEYDWAHQTLQTLTKERDFDIKETTYEKGN